MILMCAVGSCLADGAPWPQRSNYEEAAHEPGATAFGVFVFFCITMVIEYLVVYACLLRLTKDGVALFGSVLFVNVITNPAAQCVMMFFGDPMVLPSDAWCYTVICAVELVVVAVEFVLFRWIFGRMYRHGTLGEPVTVRRTLIIAMAANVASLVLPITLLHYPWWM